MKRFKLNVIDIIIIVVLIVAIAVGGFWFFVLRGDGESSTVDKVTISFDIEMQNISKDIAEGYKVGEVILGNKNVDVGTITNVDIQPQKTIAEDKETGKFIWSEIPDTYTAVITVEKEVFDTESAYAGEEEEYRIGEMMSFRGKGFAGWGGYIIRCDVVYE